MSNQLGLSDQDLEEILEAWEQRPGRAERFHREHLITQAQALFLAAHKLSFQDLLEGRVPAHLAPQIEVMFADWNAKLGLAYWRVDFQQTTKDLRTVVEAELGPYDSEGNIALRGDKRS